jgi:hypothetical protein
MLKTAVCPRCRLYVLAGQHDGAALAVDITPLSLDDYRAALMASRRCFELDTTYGGLTKARPAHPRNVGNEGIRLVGEHGCPTRSARPVEVDAAPVGPQSAPATPGRAWDGFHQPHAPARASQGRTRLPAPSSLARKSNHVQAATRPHSEKGTRYLYRRCASCGQMMGYAQPFGLQVGDHWEFVFHDPCPKGEGE